MKYAAYLIFAALILTTILFLKNALEPKNEPVSITGSPKCGECHSLQTMGNQQTVWENSKHAQAYKTLLSKKSIDFTNTSGLEAAKDNKLCLKCHTTSGFLADKEKQADYNIEEGVGCETCHGAGSKYSPNELMKSPHAFKENGGLKGDEADCIKCHNLKGSKDKKLKEDLCPFQENDFNYKVSFELIKHPLNKQNFK